MYERDETTYVLQSSHEAPPDRENYFGYDGLGADQITLSILKAAVYKSKYILL